MKWFVSGKKYERDVLKAYNQGKENGRQDARWEADGQAEKAAASTPQYIMTRAEAMKLVREAMKRTDIVANTVGRSFVATGGGFDDAWALGQVLVLEALGALKVSA